MALAVCSLACGRGAPVQRPWKEELRALDASLDRLEERLLADQANVAFWSEMRDRHEDVSAVACANLAEHAQAVAAHHEPPREKRVAMAPRSHADVKLVPKASPRR